MDCSYAIQPIGVGKAAEQAPRSHVYGRLPGLCSCFFDGVALLGISDQS